jgi:bacterioferritin
MNSAMKPDKQTMRKPEDAMSSKRLLSADWQDLIAGLNQDLAGEYRAILMYIHYSAKITGPYRRELRALFQAGIADEQVHAQFLADKVTALGGEPIIEPQKVQDAIQPRDMLEQALAVEEEAIEGYRKRIRQADKLGEIGLKVVLENQVADETRHKEEIERILVGLDDLNRERTKNEERWQDDGGQG